MLSRNRLGWIEGIINKVLDFGDCRGVVSQAVCIAALRTKGRTLVKCRKHFRGLARKNVVTVDLRLGEFLLNLKLKLSELGLDLLVVV